ncbi:hypothetical protein GQ457_15G005580 [Hibiscus cannabinus]
MEDCNMLVADCVVICCCSQCLILQIIVFVFLKLPCKLIRKTKRYATKKLLIGRRRGRGRGGRRKEEGNTTIIELDSNSIVKGGVLEDEVQVVTKSCNCMSMSMSHDHLTQAVADQYEFGYCLQEVENVLEELSRKGEFAFGSFWGRSSPDSVSVSVSDTTSSCLVANYERFDFLAANSLPHFYHIQTR